MKYGEQIKLLYGKLRWIKYKFKGMTLTFQVVNQSSGEINITFILHDKGARQFCYLSLKKKKKKVRDGTELSR